MAEEELYAEEVEGGEEGYEEDDMGGEEEFGGDADAQNEEIAAMKQRLKEMEEEAARIKAGGGGAAPAPAGEGGAAAGSAVGGGPAAAAAAAAADPEKTEIDSRSVYVGNVDYACTPEELQQHFAQCGTVNRVTILTDKFGNPKGFAYVEFLEVDAVQNAMLLDNSELRARQIKVHQKRTNVPGLKLRGRGRGRGFPGHFAAPYHGGGRGYYPPPFPRGRGGYGGGYGAPGFVPRGRGRGRFYAPY